MPIKHSFVSGKADQGDTTLIRPSDWNADHVVSNLPLSALAVDARGLEFLGSVVLEAPANRMDLTIAAKNILLVIARITSIAASDRPGFQFNGDLGTNYWDRMLSCAAGTTTWTNTQSTSNTMIRMPVVAGTQAIICLADIMNHALSTKGVTMNAQMATGAAGTAGTLAFGGGEWANAVDQITTIRMLTAASQNMAVGSGFAVWGKDL